MAGLYDLREKGMSILEKLEKHLGELALERSELEVKLEKIKAGIRKCVWEIRRQQAMLEQAEKQGERQVKKLEKEKGDKK